MRRRRKEENALNFYSDSKAPSPKMPPLLRWWTALMFLSGVLWCEAVQVTVRDERRFALLFQSVLLPCQYSSVSTQAPVVQWWYKSYCRDRTRDAFSFPENAGLRGSEPGAISNLDCADNSRTVRIVASGQGSSVTLAEYYKGRDISIVNKADLRIGELQWGDSGVYLCKVVIADDLEGQNEAQVELLVLGQTSMADDLLPEFDLEIMPEWVFVGVVVLGSILFILLVGVCWCQCCPHSCCCYVRCCCCPETCCCPRHLYEAGKGIKVTPSTPVAIYPPYYMPGVPTMVPIAPPSLIDPKISAAPSVENSTSAVHSGFRLQPTPDQNSMKVLQYVERELAHFNPSKTLSSHDSCSMSELSSLHEAEADFRQTFRQVQKKALPAIPDLDDPPDLLTREISPVHVRRSTRHPHRGNRGEEDHPRWNPRSEHLQRKAFQIGGRTGSLDELEEFAMTYMQRGRHGDFVDMEDDYRTRARQREHDKEWERERERDREREREHKRDRYPHYSSKRYYQKDSPERPPRTAPRERPRPPSPPPLPGNGKRRGTWDSGRPIPCRDSGNRERNGRDSRGRDGESGRDYDDRERSGRDPRGRDGESVQDYDDALLNSLLERKAKSGKSTSSKCGRAEEDSDTPSKSSSKKSTHSQSPSNRSPSNRPTEEDDSLPPYTEKEMERFRCAEMSQRPFTYARPAQPPQKEQEGREEQSRPRKVRPSRV
ncbi:immunoglobulin-like domain-containing receptor 2 isoform X2 [Colossoma macropomum]|uniref:immunoglobulin-like domain-containing receptor 2 isoform X2 n=1 Tax=Colossoma macropomum TaxID=42526 RepID=UPI001864C8E7|nr:immunoglobulin-like domain-containing receptor 2 isoform X2 [Colossoma macropomum]